MGTLDEFLADKRVKIATLMERFHADPQPIDMSASVEVRGRSGVRVIRTRQFELINDVAIDQGGFDLGPNSPEHLLCALGGCLAHTVEILAASMQISISKIAVDVQAQMHPLAQTPGYESIPLTPYNLRYTLRIESTAPTEDLKMLHRQVEVVCPVYNLIKQPQTVAGKFIIDRP